MSNILNSREKIRGYCVGARAANGDELMFYVKGSGSAHRSWMLEVELATLYTLQEAFAALDEIKALTDGSQDVILFDTLRVYTIKELVEIVNENEDFVNDTLYKTAAEKLSTAEMEAVRIRLRREADLDKQDVVEDVLLPGTTRQIAKLGGSYR